MVESGESIGSRGSPALAAWASTLDDAGHWAQLLDASGRYVFETEELQKTWADMGRTSTAILGSHFFSEESNRRHEEVVGRRWANPDFRRSYFLEVGPYLLWSAPGGRAELRALVDPELADLVDELQPERPPQTRLVLPEWATAGADASGSAVWIRVDDDDGKVAGFCIISKPAAGMADLAVALALADKGHLDRMRLVARPERRPSAILMADLEGSSSLTRGLSTAQYFAFGRRLVRAADRCIIDAGGIVGRHAGDGVTAFFLADTAGSESAAARSCIMAARHLRDSLAGIAARSEVQDPNLSLRFGLHWGATLYMGRFLTAGRSEVNALGDEVNEAARIEACAIGGRTLASKWLIERLNTSDASTLGINPAHMSYTRLDALDTATDKARRDAPAIPVCDIDGVDG